LTDAERAQLLRWSHGESARLAVRAKIVLACAEPGVVYEQLAGELVAQDQDLDLLRLLVLRN